MIKTTLVPILTKIGGVNFLGKLYTVQVVQHFKSIAVQNGGSDQAFYSESTKLG